MTALLVIGPIFKPNLFVLSLDCHFKGHDIIGLGFLLAEEFS